MFIDAETVPPGTVLETDLCIIGAGAAGLAMADRLESGGPRVLLVESGGLTAEPEIQSLNRGKSNHPDYPFTTSRSRGFGGTTTLWSGACIPMDPLDFQPRSWIAHSGWPLSYAEVEPYWARAARFFALPRADEFQSQLELSPFHSQDLQSKTVFFPGSMDLGKKLKQRIRVSRSVTCLLHATATLLQQRTRSETVEALNLRTVRGNELTVNAGRYVLAGGGIENARMLLVSRQQARHSSLHELDALGRYHMEHPIRNIGILELCGNHPQLRHFTHPRANGRGRVLGSFGLSWDRREREQLLDLQIRAYRYHPLEGTAAVIQAKAAAKAGGFRELAACLRAHGPREASRMLPYAAWHVWNKITPRAGYRHLRLTAFVEQEPDPENRLLLADQTDKFGVPLPRLLYNESPWMRESINRSLEIMAADLQKRGVGALRYQPDDIAHLGFYDNYGLHHMGSTRMSDHPRDGVVDRNCKVHGISNLYVAGSSVFPTGGSANPTLTLVALALRLADHLSIKHSS